MSKLQWDQVGERKYETGTDRGVLYIPTAGVYNKGYAWNGLTAVTQAPSGAEPNAQYADNMKYLNLLSAEDFGGTIEAFTYPDEFMQCDGTSMPVPGLSLGQQPRKTFGFSYRTRLGNDVDGNDYGYKLHLIYGALAAPSEKAYATVNDSPEAITLSWEFSTTAVQVDGYKPTAILSIDSTKFSKDAMDALELVLYGDAGTDPRLPLPDEVIAMLSGTVVQATPEVPSFDSATGAITVPTTAGITYYRADTNKPVTGTVTVSGGAGSSLVVYALPNKGYRLPAGTDNDWQFTRTA